MARAGTASSVATPHTEADKAHENVDGLPRQPTVAEDGPAVK